MTRLNPTTAKKLTKFLKIHSYCEDRQSGSHLTLRNDTKHKSITIPVHPSRKIGKGLLKYILNEAGFTVEEFNKGD